MIQVLALAAALLIPLDPGAMAEAMRKSLGAAEARIEIVELSRGGAPAGELVFPLEGYSRPSSGSAPGMWNGYAQYEGGRYPIWARVRVTVKRSQVVAAATLTPGRRIRPEDVKLLEDEGPPRRVAAAQRLDAVVGRAPRSVVAAGTAIRPEVLEEPALVRKGEMVTVEVRENGILLRLSARADSSGAAGEVVQMRNLESGKRFRGRVETRGVVLAGGFKEEAQ
jgi:flagella basal body P-ring formation protein FlgA